MAEIKVDTLKLKECGKDIMNLSTELNEVLLSLYDRLNKMPVSTGEWTGNSAVEYVQKLNIEKKYYLGLKNNIYKYGKLLYDTAYQIEKINKELNS